MSTRLAAEPVMLATAETFVDLPAMVSAQARAAPHKLAVVEGGRRLGYGQLCADIERVACSLQRDGLRPGEAVAICAAGSIEYLVAMLGILRAGGVVVPLPALATPAVLLAMLDDSAARLLFADRAAADALHAAQAASVRVLEFGSGEFEQWLAPAGSIAKPVAIKPEARFAIIYSSGTTGRPKGVVHSQHMRWRGIRAGLALGIDADTVSLVSTPLYSNTTWVVLWPTLAVGGTLVLMPKFDAQAFLNLSARYRVTHAMLVPTQYQRIMSEPGFPEHDLGSYRMKMSTGAPFAAALKMDVLQRWPGRLIEFYGLTEGAGVTMLDAGEHPDKLHSVGQPLPGHEFRLIGDDDREVRPGQRGEIVSRAPDALPGYHGAAQKLAESHWCDAAGRGYFRTGDIGRFDGDGFLSIVGRRKDMIISGGFNLYPQDLEDLLLRHEAVADAAVVGQASARWGETPVAYVTLKAGAAVDSEALRQWANERLAKTQRISRLCVLAELPRSALGKLLKSELRRLT